MRPRRIAAGCGLLWAGLALAAGPPTPVILISVDTLRADRLGCYGYKKIRTPNIDSLSEHGSVFLSVDSPVPLTLPAHTSLFTSTYPFVHGIRNNGEQVRPGAVTLAGLLRARGYRTAAFIGGYALDAQFGLGQGFELYDSPFDVHPMAGEDAPGLKRRGESVIGAASHWLDKQRADHPFFLFLHLYDLHEPYARTALPGHSAYDTQVSYVDRILGQFWDILNKKGLMQGALIVFTSDHGESLGEHGELTHGYFIYESTLRVPLVFHWPSGGRSYPARIDTPASLLDVAPTILEFLGVPQPPQFQGKSLLRSTEEEIYAESFYARDHLGFSALRSLRLGNRKYIEAPKPELYDLSSDPLESHNLYESERSLALDLGRRLRALEALYTPTPARPPSKKSGNQEVTTQLRSLGYLGSGNSGSHRKTGPDPKDRLGEYLQYGRGIRYASNNRLPDAIREFEEVLKQDASNTLARYYLAVCYYRSGLFDEAVKQLQTTLALTPDYWQADELLGTIWLQKKDYSRAREQFIHLLKLTPGDYGAHYNLGVLALQAGRLDEAGRELSAAAKADPRSAQAAEALGSLYLQQGHLDLARDEFEKAIRLNPKLARAHYELGTVLWKKGMKAEAAGQFREALGVDPSFVSARQALERIGENSKLQ